ncbi:MAG: nuclear transport factor 2 family protein [Chthoniobacterales bacterium]
MKSITASIVAITVLSLCATPFVRAQGANKVEAKLKAMEDSWSAAQLQKDHGVSVIEGLLASDYHGVNSKGKMQGKSEALEELRSSTDTYNSSKNDSMEVHTYGSHVATVCGTSSEAGKDKDGKEFSRSYAWTDTWMERNGHWECIAEAVTLLPEKE